MTRRAILTAAAAAPLARAALAETKPPQTPPLTEGEVAAIEAALGKKGRLVDGEALHTTALPRNDLKVTVKGEPVPIPFGFGGWVSVKRTADGKKLLLMSDAVLLPQEVAPVMDAALASGLEISALHNHFFYEEPRIVYMHVHGTGDDAGDLAGRYASAIKGSPLHPSRQPAPNPNPPKPAFDTAALDAIVGAKATPNGPTVKYTIGRADLRVMDMGAELTAAIGLNSWASFAGTMDSAHIAGDVAMLEGEVSEVIPALRQAGLEVVALHHHVLFESPRIVFLHYYGRGPALELARGFRSALERLGKKRRTGHG